MTIIGVEFGQRRNPSAICVATNPLRTIEGHEERHFLIRSMERLGAGTTFPDLAARLSEMRAGARRQAPRERIAVYVNATGVGDPQPERRCKLGDPWHGRPAALAPLVAPPAA